MKLRSLLVPLFLASLSPAIAAEKPKLVVMISVDQFASHVFDQWRPKFTGGLKTLSSGVVYPSGYQAHAATETCPGHVTLLTGVHPARSGIVANNWYDTGTGRDTYCMLDRDARLLGFPASIPAEDPRRAPRSPKNMTATTLGDWLQAASPNSKVFALSGKDRGAITMAGQNPTGVFWFVDGVGFLTYAKQGVDDAQRMQPVAQFNTELVSAWAKKPPQWRYFDKKCAKLAATVPAGNFDFQSQVPPDLPEPFKGSAFDTVNDKAGYYKGTPLLDDITLKLARKLIIDEKLGQRGATDILAIGLSATDYIGHRYGTQGPEMCDQLARLDSGLKILFQQLSKLKIPYLVALSADHGSMDIAERTAAAGYPAMRLAPIKILSELNQKLRDNLQLSFYNPLAAASGGRDLQQLHIINAEGKAEMGELKDKIRAETLKLLADYKPDILEAFTREQALAAMPDKTLPMDEYSMLQRFAVNADSKRSGDIFVSLKPYVFGGFPEKLGDTVASHGTPYNYDRRVPILFWWPGASPQERPLPIATVDIAPTLASALGLPVPLQMDGKPVDGRCRPLLGPCPAP
jgi:predicted AlkP superfamily pyrophosphatase or phosphodiesterase